MMPSLYNTRKRNGICHLHWTSQVAGYLLSINTVMQIQILFNRRENSESKVKKKNKMLKAEEG